MTNDATAEAVAAILRDNPRGVMRYADELVGFLRGMNVYRGGKGADRQFYLSCWSGTPAQVDRKGEEETSLIRSPFLVVFGGIQPDMLATLEDERGRDDGFAQRFLFSFPEPRPPRSLRDAPGLPPGALGPWADAVGRLFALEMDDPPPGEPDRTPRPRTIRFAPEAAEAFYDWHAAHSAQAAWDCFPPHLKGLWSKFDQHALALVLVAHLLRSACEPQGAVGESPVDAESARRGLALAEYFKDQNVRALGRLKADPEEVQVGRLIEWVRRRPGRRATAREVQQNNVAGVKKASEAKALFKSAEDRGLGAVLAAEGRGGGKSVAFQAA